MSPLERQFWSRMRTGKGISRAIRREGKILYKFCCRTALTLLPRRRLLPHGSLRGDVATPLRAIKAEGAQSIGAITAALNARQIPSVRGTRWHVSSVMNLLARAQKLEAVR